MKKIKTIIQVLAILALIGTIVILSFLWGTHVSLENGVFLPSSLFWELTILVILDFIVIFYALIIKRIRIKFEK
jgi:hypothetical protein